MQWSTKLGGIHQGPVLILILCYFNCDGRPIIASSLDFEVAAHWSQCLPADVPLIVVWILILAPVIACSK